MTIENLYYNGKITKAENIEKKGPKFNYAYDKNCFMFKSLQEAVCVNTVATFSSNPTDLYNARLNEFKGKTDDYSEKMVKKIMDEWYDELNNMPYYQRPTNGDASETALIKFFQPIEDIDQNREKYNTAKNIDGSDAEIKVNSKHKFSAKVKEVPAVEQRGYSYMGFLKGAPERVWDQCSYIMIDGKPEILDSYWRNEIENANKTFAKMGQRVLGFANMLLPESEYPRGHRFDLKSPYELNLPQNGFCFVG